MLNFLRKHPLYKNSEITVCDRNPHLQILPRTAVTKTNIQFRTGADYLRNLNQFDIIFRSPGVPYNLPEIQKALKAGVKVSSVTKLFFTEANRIGCRIIGVSGTKGKGTTSTLIYRMLKAGGKNVFLAGNIGKPAVDLLPRLFALSAPKSAVVVLELSSFQLQDLGLSPEIAVVLDIFPDHLDVHKNFREYVNAEAGIAKWQKKSDKVFFFADNKYSQWIARKSRGRKIPVSFENFSLFEQKDLKIPGYHNFKNAAMAATVCLSLGCPKEKIIKTARAFRGNEHRLEFVRNIKGIKFYNDSASTVPQTTAAAIFAFGEPKILIAGGRDKNLNYAPLAKALKNSNTELVVLFGENKRKIKQALERSAKHPEIRMVKDLPSAVKLAYQSARRLQTEEKHRSVAVIFSPASVSFDMFLNYAERGKVFKKIVKNL